MKLSLPKVSNEEWSDLGKACAILLIIFNTIVSVKYLVFEKAAAPILQVSQIDLGFRLPDIQAKYEAFLQQQKAVEEARKTKLANDLAHALSKETSTTTSTTYPPEPPSPSAGIGNPSAAYDDEIKYDDDVTPTTVPTTTTSTTVR